MRSGFIPRFLGVLLMFAGVGYVASSFGELVVPQYAQAIGQVTGILTLLELPIIFWLLIWGAKTRPTDAASVPS
jgi:cytochrome c biogenesis protein CcdA